MKIRNMKPLHKHAILLGSAQLTGRPLHNPTYYIGMIDIGLIRPELSAPPISKIQTCFRIFCHLTTCQRIFPGSLVKTGAAMVPGRSVHRVYCRGLFRHLLQPQQICWALIYSYLKYSYLKSGIPYLDCLPQAVSWCLRMACSMARDSMTELMTTPIYR